MLLNALHDLSIINNFPTNLIALFTFSVCGSGKTNVSAPPKQWQRNLIRFSLDIHLRIRGGGDDTLEVSGDEVGIRAVSFNRPSLVT